MPENELNDQAKKAALAHGTDLPGMVSIEDLTEHSERVERMLPDN